MFGFGKKRAIEKEMADWLAHPAEFGVQPKSVRLKRTYRGEVINTGAVEIHLVEYEMPDGTQGRGFVNGPLTWSFLSDLSGRPRPKYAWASRSGRPPSLSRLPRRSALLAA